LDGDHDRLAESVGAPVLVTITGDPMARASNFGAEYASMCKSAPGWLHAKRRNVWRVPRRRRETPWCLRTFQIVARWRPVNAARRIGPQFVRARASKIAASSAALSACGQLRGIGRRGQRHEKSARPDGSLACQRCHAVLTVFGEHAIERAIARNDSPA
jgi:hypothetical protein